MPVGQDRRIEKKGSTLYIRCQGKNFHRVWSFFVTKPPSSRIAYLESIKKWPVSLVTTCGVI
jgi:hypothetical protein